MPGKKRNQAQRANHREKIAELRLKSVPVSQIAKQLRISDSTVNRELAILSRQWKAQAQATMDTVKERELQRLELIERKAWAEYERSREDYFKHTEEDIELKGGDGEDGKSVPATKHKKETGGRLGDPKYLQIALNASEARRKLLGLDAPSKVAATSPDGKEERPMGFFPVPPPTSTEAWLQWVESLRQKPAQT
jgi:hypothetical protein